MLRAVLLILAGSCLSYSASAQTALERIEPRLAKAIEEHRVFLTCSRLEAESVPGIREGWVKMVADARQYLAAHFTSLADLAAFDKRTDPETLIGPPDRPFGEVIAFCDKNAGWMKRMLMFNFVFKIDDTPLPGK